MPRRGASITQADIARAIRAMRDAGVRDVRVVFRPDGVSIEAGPPEQQSLDRREVDAEPEKVIVV